MSDPTRMTAAALATLGDVAPDGLVTRMRQGEGAHETNRVAAVAPLLICSSTSIAVPPGLATFLRLAAWAWTRVGLG